MRQRLTNTRTYSTISEDYIGTEHLLLALVSGEPGEPATTLLANLGIDFNKTRASVEFIIGRGERPIKEAIRAQAAEESLTPAQESVSKLKAVLENPNISQRTKTFIMGLVDKMTEFAAQEDTSEPTS